jgi:hypothetical protein
MAISSSQPWDHLFRRTLLRVCCITWFGMPSLLWPTITNAWTGKSSRRGAATPSSINLQTLTFAHYFPTSVGWRVGSQPCQTRRYTRSIDATRFSAVNLIVGE